MLDSDLAELYTVETKNLKRAVRANIERFPADFMFELTKEEYDAIRCKNFTLKIEDDSLRCKNITSKGGRGKHSKYLPFAFTREGIAANLVGRRYLGIEREKEFVEISQKRREEIEDIRVYSQFRQKIKDIAKTEALKPSLYACEDEPIIDLPF